MASLIKPGSVKVVAKDGEVQVSLTIDLNLNINNLGVSGVMNETASGSDSALEPQEKKRKDFEWAIPDFEEAPKINFGKKEG